MSEGNIHKKKENMKRIKESTYEVIFCLKPHKHIDGLFRGLSTHNNWNADYRQTLQADHIKKHDDRISRTHHPLIMHIILKSDFLFYWGLSSRT